MDTIFGVPVVVDEACPPGQVFLVDSAVVDNIVIRTPLFHCFRQEAEPDYPIMLTEIEWLDQDGGE
jgi:hypothetical protein